MNKILIFLLNIFLILDINLNNVLSDTISDKCCTPAPDHSNGWCVPLEQCKILHESLKRPLSSIPPHYQAFIRNSKCSDNLDEKYCCVLKHIDPEFARVNRLDEASYSIPCQNVANTMERGDSFNLDEHPNLKLLEGKCGIIPTEGKVSGGNLTGFREFTFMARLLSGRQKPTFECGGTLINEKYVLTAAHCITTNLISVRLGEHNAATDQDCIEDEDDENQRICNDPVQDIPIEKKIRHEKFDMYKSYNDIGLLRLSRPANLKKNNVQTICLPTTFVLRNEVFHTAQLVGWGTTERGKLSDVLLKADVNINAERQKCIDNYSQKLVNITDKIICVTGENIVDSCNGDSGGPLLKQFQLKFGVPKQYMQFGVVSSGPIKKCGDTNKVGGSLFTNVNHYMKWILNNISP